MSKDIIHKALGRRGLSKLVVTCRKCKEQTVVDLTSYPEIAMAFEDALKEITDGKDSNE